MKGAKFLAGGVIACAFFPMGHFFIGKESRVYAQEHTGLLRKVVRVGFPFWQVDLIVFTTTEELIETPYSRYLRERLTSFENLHKEARWLLASGGMEGLLYPDKRKFVSASGFEIFPLPSIRNDRVYDFLVDASNRKKITPQELSGVIVENEHPLAIQEALEAEYEKWLKTVEPTGSRRETLNSGP